MWDNVRSLRTGLDGDEKGYRQTVFGDNVIDIEDKTSMQILVDEVGGAFGTVPLFAKLKS